MTVISHRRVALLFVASTLACGGGSARKSIAGTGPTAAESAQVVDRARHAVSDAGADSAYVRALVVDSFDADSAGWRVGLTPPEVAHGGAAGGGHEVRVPREGRATMLYSTQ